MISAFTGHSPLYRSKKKKNDDRKSRTPEEKDRRTADRGMARIYVSAGKSDGFFAGNLIDLLNHTIQGQRIDVGRIDLMPGYSLFDVKKADARRVVDALKGTDFIGHRLHAEIADPEKDYSRASNRRKREVASAKDNSENDYNHFDRNKKSRRTKTHRRR